MGELMEVWRPGLKGADKNFCFFAQEGGVADGVPCQGKGARKNELCPGCQKPWRRHCMDPPTLEAWLRLCNQSGFVKRTKLTHFSTINKIDDCNDAFR